MQRAALTAGLTVAVAALSAAGAHAQVPDPKPPPPACTPKFPAKLSIARTTVLGGVLDVLAPITARASGSAGVEYVAAGRRTRFAAPIDSADGRIRLRRVLSAAQARLGTGIVTIAYPGDADTRPQAVRLRGARNRAALLASRPQIVGDRVLASGRVTSRARGVVRLQVEYENAACAYRLLTFRGRIGDDGRWSVNRPIPAAALAEIATRRGTVHSYTLFTGYLPQRIRGEMRSYQVLATP